MKTILRNSGDSRNKFVNEWFAAEPIHISSQDGVLASTPPHRHGWGINPRPCPLVEDKSEDNTIITIPLVRDSFIESQGMGPPKKMPAEAQGSKHSSPTVWERNSVLERPGDPTRDSQEESFEIQCPHDLEPEEPERGILMTFTFYPKGGGLWSVVDGHITHLVVAKNTGAVYCDCGQYRKGKGTHSGCRHLNALLVQGPYASPPTTSRAWDSRTPSTRDRSIYVHPHWYGMGRHAVDQDVQETDVKRKVQFWTLGALQQPMPIPVWDPGDE